MSQLRFFYLEASARLEERATSTGRACRWKMPTFQWGMEYAPAADIDFTSAKRKKALLAESTSGGAMRGSGLQLAHAVVAVPSAAEKSRLLERLSKCAVKPAVLSTIKTYADAFVPVSATDRLPPLLTDLFREEHVGVQQEQLVQIGRSLSLNVSEEQVKAVEEATREQRKSRLWHAHRAGRVTASRMHSVCHTSTAKPSVSLVKAICYPEEMAFTSPATEWGVAQDLSAFSASHDKADVHDVGFVINPKWPHIGASADGIVTCDCCGTGALELKCPGQKTLG